MSSPADSPSPRGVVSLVSAGDQLALTAAARLLDAFNREYDDPSPGPDILAARLGELIGGGDTDVLVTGRASQPHTGQDWVGVAVLRHRRSLWTAALESTLAELYVKPSHRGIGLGRHLIDAAVAHAIDRGADYLEVVTTDEDVAAWHLYESVGFRRTEGVGGPIARFYERDL